MALEQNVPPAPPARRRFAALVSMELMLDLAERVAVLLLFLLFVNRMLPRLVQLVLIQREHPEVSLLAAGVNAQALLLVLSEFLGVLLILIRRRSASLSTHPFDRALSFSAVSAPEDDVATVEGDVIGQCVAYCPWQDSKGTLNRSAGGDLGHSIDLAGRT